ncbi:MAG: N-6 DNA methylase [Bacteroidota bacterium]
MNIYEYKIGDIFTPPSAAHLFIEKFNLLNRWLNGESVFDPTMGTGNLIVSLIEAALKKGCSIDELPLHKLYGNELNTSYFQDAITKLSQLTDNKFIKENFTNCDVFELNIKEKVDIIFGNPPWMNFNELPADLKQKYTSLFFEYSLVNKGSDVLLGNSRVDIAALVIQKSIANFLKDKGDAFFFLPLSLFHNDGATKNFRKLNVKNLDFSVECIYELNNQNTFENVSTKYGFAHFKKNKQVSFPISYYKFENGTFVEYIAQPLHQITDPYIVLNKNEKNNPLEKILIPDYAMPRQGVNTCGCNKIFFIDNIISADKHHYECSINQQIYLLPKKFIYPLITSSLFKGQSEPHKFVLLPYHQNGYPLSWQEIEQYPELKKYLLIHKNELFNRKGILLNTWIKKGIWWAMLGVGDYNFYPFKIVWEAYGKKEFNPILIDGKWQANQSLHAYIPCKLKEEASRILSALKNSSIEKFLKAFQTEGTMNWAQPGKIKKFLITHQNSSLFDI